MVKESFRWVPPSRLWRRLVWFHHRLGGTSCLYKNEEHSCDCFCFLAYISTQKIDAVCFSETSVDFDQTTGSHNPEDTEVFFFIMTAVRNWNLTRNNSVSKYCLQGTETLVTIYQTTRRHIHIYWLPWEYQILYPKFGLFTRRLEENIQNIASYCGLPGIWKSALLGGCKSFGETQCFYLRDPEAESVCCVTWWFFPSARTWNYIIHSFLNYS